MKLTRWEPFREADEFFRQFGNVLPNRWLQPERTAGEVSAWTPAADITETDKEYLVKAEVPGVKPGDIKVTLDNGVLAIEGERRFEHEDQSEKSHRVERYYGNFVRRFTLPDDANAAAISAEGKDGVLKVHVPKMASAPAATPRQIKVE
jgi:HSP20 family protein